MIDSICQWLRDGGDDEAASILQQCEIDTHYVDTLFEVAGDRSYDLFDVNIAARRDIHQLVERSNALCEQIEVAIRRQAEADGVYVRGIKWIPLVTTPTAQKDQELDGILSSFDAEHVTRFWKKALTRKTTDPDGAITAARSMLESTCKHVLASEGLPFDPASNLPTLFHATLDVLELAPRQQTDAVLRQVMGNCQSIVNGLASIRNDIGDAHGKASNETVADSIHAEFAVNLAASVAMLVLGQYDRMRTHHSKPAR